MLFLPPIQQGQSTEGAVAGAVLLYFGLVAKNNDVNTLVRHAAVHVSKVLLCEAETERVISGAGWGRKEAGMGMGVKGAEMRGGMGLQIPSLFTLLLSVDGWCRRWMKY